MPRLCLLMACILAFSHQVVSQQKLLDSLKQIVAANKKDTVYIVALARIGQRYRGKDNDKALYYFRKIIVDAHVYPVQSGKTYVAMGLIYIDRNQYDSASMSFAEAENIAKRFPDNTPLWSILYNGYGLYYKKLGDYQKSLEYFMLVDKLGEAGLGKENIAGNYLNIANTYNRMGNRREAIQHLYKALSVFESLGNKKGMSYCYNSLGLLLQQQGNLSAAEEFLKKSLALKEADGDQKGIANSCNELALLYISKRQWEDATQHIDRTIELCERLGSHELMATALLNKGKIFRLQAKYNEASAIFENAKTFIGDLPGQFQRAGLYTEIGRLHYEQKDNSKAIASLLSGLDAAVKSSNVEVLLDAHLFLSEAYAANRQHAEALDQFQKYHSLQDSVSGSKLKLEYKALETQYEVEKKNAEIELLKKDQELQAQIVERQQAIQLGTGIALISVIIASIALVNRYRVVNKTRRQLEIERVRNTIARDLHDDIGSTMSSINIVSQMALREKHVNGTAEDHFKRIAAQSGEIMERMSDIVWSINPANDSIPIMISRMKEFSAEILEPANITYDFHAPEYFDGHLPLEKRRNIFLIFKEAINNVAKYSGANKVSVTMTPLRKKLQLQIADDGNGFDFARAQKGNGLKNIIDRAKSIGAEATIESDLGKGTRISLEVPLT